MEMTTQTQIATQRRHDLDALRAFAMLLGIALHAALSFTSTPWPVQDSRPNALWILFVTAIHGFRMPLFFLISGFFTAMLWRQRGKRFLLKHRFQRVFLPFLLAMATITPLVHGYSVGLLSPPCARMSILSIVLRCSLLCDSAIMLR
jgi:fucose 4-O-acetylase-like acetyltransferase